MLLLMRVRAMILKIKTDRIMEQYSEHSRTTSTQSRERSSETGSLTSRMSTALSG